jgi:dipeptidase E
MYSNVADQLLSLISDSPENLAVAFIPTAADPYEDKSFIDVDRNKLVEQGFKVKDLKLQNQTVKDLRKELSDIDIIFFAGGNTFYLLQQIQQTGLDKIIHQLLEHGKIYVGSSAGSVIAGPNIEPVKSFDDPSEAPELTNYRGLDLVSFVSLPHYGKPRYEDRYQQVIKEYTQKGFELKTLKDDEFYIQS